MLQITFQIPIVGEDSMKPAALANQQLPYNSISSPRRFEELVYSLIKEQLGVGLFAKFDSISLMSGVSEQGRDCSLFKDGKITGIIQCKKKQSNLSKNEFGKEITKFVLYSLLDERLINNPENFLYCISVTKGFVRECSDFIDSFHTSIATESNLKNWINENLNSFSSLSPLRSHNSLVADVINKLTKIKVHKISPSDLDVYFQDPRSTKLIGLFFEIKTVTDNFWAQKLIEKLDNDTKFDGIRLNNELIKGSISLKSERNEFSEIPDSHIIRSETNELYSWIKSDLTKDNLGRHQNLCLLAGNAGMGKTVILKDFYEKLSQENYAVLGLKSDKLASTSVRELQDKIGLPISVYSFIEECKREFPLTVIVIDQIDALSQSMSSDRSFLQVFKDLIEQYLYDSSIRIVISIRIFDLHYDPSLRLYKDIDTILVKPLPIETVHELLRKIGISKSAISPKLLELLRTPNHLNVFSQIYKINQRSLGVTTLQDMYLELWKQKIINLKKHNPNQKQNIKELLYNIANKMFEDQQITVSALQFEDYSQELSYLESERLIKRENHQLQFFHQSFYDFLFAKQFVESGKSVIDYIKNNGQSLLIRSAVKMIISYLRDYDVSSYVNVIRSIFDDREVLFHFKHMIFSILLFVEFPSAKEKEIIKKEFKNSLHLGVLFFEQGQSEIWFEFALVFNLTGILNGSDENIRSTFKDADSEEIIVLKNACFFFLRNAVQQNFHNALKMISDLKDQSLIRNILFVVKDWNDPLLYQLFEGCNDFEVTDSFGYYHILNSISKFNPEYALNALSNTLLKHHKKNNREKDYQERDVLKTLAKSIPEKLFPILFDAVKTDFNESDFERHIISDYTYKYVDLRDKDSLTGREYLYQLLGVCLKRAARNKSNEYKIFLNNHKNSRFEPILRLLIFSLTSNEKEYLSEIFDLFAYVNKYGEKHYDSPLPIELRNLFETSFAFFSVSQKELAIDVIRKIVVKKEIICYKESERKISKIWSDWGMTKYSWLRRLPKKTVLKNPILKKEFQELERRFPKYKEPQLSYSVLAGIVGKPLPDKAYSTMNNRQWLASFKKYDGTISRFDRHHLKGDVDEHSTAFKNYVKDNPTDETLQLLISLIGNSSVKPIYLVKGLWGWSESKINLSAIVPLYFDMLNWLDSDVSLRYECLFTARNLIFSHDENPLVLKFLIKMALDFAYEERNNNQSQEKETSQNGLIASGLNTISGLAAEPLLHIKGEKYKDLIFSTMEELLKNGSDQLRSFLLSRFAYLMNLDQERAYVIFKRVILEEDNVHVLASALWSLQYMSNYDFVSLIPVYEKLTNTSILGQEDSNWLFAILYASFLHDKPNSKQLILNLVENYNHASTKAIQDIMDNYYEIPNTKHKNDWLLSTILHKVSEKDYGNLAWNFSKSLTLKLDDIETFLTEYIQSRFFKLTDSFINYLTFQCRQFPLKAMFLFDMALRSNRFLKENYQSDRSTESVTKFIVAAFNSLQNQKNDEDKRFQLMKSFDNVLKDHRFKKYTERVLEDLV